ncbi:MAG: glycosyl hydrolase 53 family protein [Flavisolibacter sp.]
MKNYLTYTLVLFSILIIRCNKHPLVVPCGNPNFNTAFSTRNFKMGFTTWPFGPTYNDRISTYDFISHNADIYSEQFDNYIPWSALINNQPLPKDLTDDIASRLSLKPAGHKSLLSISLLNVMRDGLLPDIDGTLPVYTSISDSIISNAYIKFVKYLVDQFHPDYLVIAMEVNEFRIKKADQWNAYLSLTGAVTTKLKTDYPTLKISSSITLHNWYMPNVADTNAFIKEMADYENAQDFVAISFYPYLKGLSTRADFQKAFDFLHSQNKKPIAFTETGHIAQNLSVPSYHLSITSDMCQQNDYLETLLTNASQHQYEFVIWWAHRDFDALWQTFPDSTKDLGKLWKNIGLVDDLGKVIIFFNSLIYLFIL